MLHGGDYHVVKLAHFRVDPFNENFLLLLICTIK